MDMLVADAAAEARRLQRNMFLTFCCNAH